MLGQPLPVPGQAGPGQGTKLCHLLADEALLRRISGNAAGNGEDCVSALRSLNLPDSFWTDEFKVVPCAKTYSHKWTLCPCAHIGETARRRCPRTVNYKAVLCPLVKAKKTCPLGDSCTYAHNTFEVWLHPSRYKTRLCSFGRNCNRSICFFAHSAEELRCVPMGEEEKADDSGYLMQLLVAQESGLLPAGALHPPTAMPPPLGVSGMMPPDLNSALQQALQCPLPPSNRPSVNGLPDAPPLVPGRTSINGLGDLLPGQPSLTGMQDASASLLAARASLSGLQDGPGGIVVPGRHSLTGLAEASGLLVPPRPSLNGLQDIAGLGVGGVARGRPSLSGVPGDPANVLLSMSVQNSMQRAFSSELNGPLHAAAMQRALSSDLGVGGAGGGAGGPFHAAAMSMQRAMSSDLGVGTSAQFHQAAAAAAAAANAAFGGAGSAAAAAQAAAMERALSRELGGSAALERAYSGREGLPGAVPLTLERALTNSRSLGVSAGRDIALAHTTSINSVESDSLINMGGGLAGFGHIGGGNAGMGFAGAAGYDLGLGQADSQGPLRLSDPGGNLHMHGRGSQLQADAAGGALGLLGKDLAGLESLLPLVNNALASGALSLPPSSAASAQAVRAVRRSNSGSTSGRVVSPPLHDGGPLSGSPVPSGTLTPLSPNSAAGGDLAAEVAAAQHQARLQASAGSPPPDGLAQEAVLPAGAAPGSGGGVIDQAYLNDLVARLQDQGVNKEQLVSSLSQLLAQLLSVGN